MKKIFITGANGFIGGHLCKKLTGENILCQTYSVDNFNYPYVNVNLLDANKLQEVISDYMPDVIIHLAGIASPTFGNISEIYNVNVGGTENLLDAVRKAGNNPRVILASTAGVYGNQYAEYYSEDLPISPVNHYSCSKASMEYMSRNYSDCADIVRVRPFNIIGLGQRSDFIVPKLVKAFAQRVTKLEVGNMDSLRDFIDVEYCVEVLVKLIYTEAVPDIINICQGTVHSGNDLLQILGELTGYTPKINVTSEFVRPNEVWRLIGDPTRLNNFMGKKSDTTLSEILLKLLEEYK